MVTAFAIFDETSHENLCKRFGYQKLLLRRRNIDIDIYHFGYNNDKNH